MQKALLQLGLIIRFHSYASLTASARLQTHLKFPCRDVLSLGVQGYAGNAPAQLTEALRAETVRFASACDVIERQLVSSFPASTSLWLVLRLLGPDASESCYRARHAKSSRFTAVEASCGGGRTSCCYRDSAFASLSSTAAIFKCISSRANE